MLLACSILLVIIAGILYGLALFVIEKKGASVRVLYAQLEEDTHREQNVNTLRHLVTDTAKERASLDRYFVSGGDVVGFIEYIESLGRRSGASVELSSVDVINTEPKTLQISFKATGSWESVAYMLSLAETIPMSIEIIKMSFKRSENENDKKVKKRGRGSLHYAYLVLLNKENMDFSFIKKYIRPAKKEWREKQERSPELDWRVLLS